MGTASAFTVRNGREAQNLVGLTEREATVSGPLTDVADEDLLRLAGTGRTAALDELTRRYQAQIYRLLLRLTGSPQDAEEATIDVFVRAWQHAGRFQYRAKVGTWLYRIAVNIARDVFSRKKARPQDPWPETEDIAYLGTGSAEDDALRVLEQQESSDALRNAIARLADADRLLITLYYLEDRDYDEMQAATGLSYTVLKTRLARARKRLRALMEDGRGRSTR